MNNRSNRRDGTSAPQNSMKNPNRNLENLDFNERQLVEWSRATVMREIGKDLQRMRGMFIERSYSHILDAGGMRRTTPRGRANIQKRYCIAALGYDSALMMQTLFDAGMPKQWAAMGLDGLISICSQIIHAATDSIETTVRGPHIGHRWRYGVSPIMLGVIVVLLLVIS